MSADISDSDFNSDELSDNVDGPRWHKTFILFPKFALFAGETGTRRTLILPGHYFKRRSRRYRQTVYRAIR